MKVYLKGAVVGFSFIFVLMAGVYWADQKGYFLLRHLEFQATAAKDFSSTMAYQDLQKYLERRLQSYKGKSLLSINMKAMTHELAKHDWIESIYVRRSFPNRLNIEVKPKEWIAYLHTEQSFYPITKSGELLPRVDVIDGPDLPLVAVTKAKWNEDLHKPVLELLGLMPESGLITLKSLQEIRSDKEGLYIIVSPLNTMIRLGSDELALKLARSEKVLEYLHQRNLQGRVINSNFAQKVVVKLYKDR
jgi:cell division septal protein FtsQ